MKPFAVVSFAEGAKGKHGTAALVGIPAILSSLAARGHTAVMAVSGSLSSVDVGGNLSLIEVRKFRKLTDTWSVSPAMPLGMLSQVRRADFVMLHSLYSFPVAVGFVLARLFNKPYGLWPHGVLASAQRRVSRRKKQFYDLVLAHRILDSASLLLFSGAKEESEALGLNLRPRSVVVPHGIAWEAFDRNPVANDFRQRHDIDADAPLVLYVGRLNAKKGLDLLLNSFALVRKTASSSVLAICGEADPPAFLQDVRQLIDALGLNSSVRVVGAISDGDKLQALKSASVFVSGSEAENFGFAIFEALAAGAPCVVSDTLDYSESLAAQEAALVVSRTPGQFADAIVKVIHEPAVAKRLAENGRLFSRSFSWDRSASLLEAAIHGVLDAGRDARSIRAVT